MAKKLPEWKPEDVLYCPDCRIAFEKKDAILERWLGGRVYACPKCRAEIEPIPEAAPPKPPAAS